MDAQPKEWKKFSAADKATKDGIEFIILSAIEGFDDFAWDWGNLDEYLFDASHLWIRRRRVNRDGRHIIRIRFDFDEGTVHSVLIERDRGEF